MTAELHPFRVSLIENQQSGILLDLMLFYLGRAKKEVTSPSMTKHS